MERPLDIAFHNLQPSPSVEAMIRQHVDRLARRNHRLIGCRVSVEGLHRQHTTGNIAEVHITLSLPGQELAISREPHKAKQRYVKPSVRTAVRDAFRAAERQLDAQKGKRRGGSAKPGAPLPA